MSIASVWYYIITVQPRQLELAANSYKVRFPLDLPPQFYSVNSWIPWIPRLLELISFPLITISPKSTPLTRILVLATPLRCHFLLHNQ